MADADPLHVATDDRGVATLTLTRPAVRNAFDAGLVAALSQAARQLADDPSIRAALLTGEGSAFSAGADLEWMRSMRDAGPDENRADARRLQAMLRDLDHLDVPLIGRINGPAMGGGVGLVAVCDVAVATASAFFAFSEVRLGLAPAVVAPYVVRAMGRSTARALFVTGRRFDAAEALAWGLVHEVVPDERLDDAVEVVVGHCLAGARQAQAACKRLPDLVAGPPDEFEAETADLIADLRASDEGQEGMTAFLERRPPRWARD